MSTLIFVGFLISVPNISEVFISATDNGCIDKFIGDAIMIIFGAPVEMIPTRQARLALQCALKMQETMKELNREWSQAGVDEIRMRIGIHHGPVVVGNFGSELRSDYTAIGPMVNKASRIETACTPGEIFLSGELCDYLEEKWFEEAGLFEMKGIKGKLCYTGPNQEK